MWDSLAILEYLAENIPRNHLWPKSAKARAEARSVSAEMHSGFATFVTKCRWTYSHAGAPRRSSEALEADIGGSSPSGATAAATYGTGGPFLFGAFTNADAMFAPVATRFRTYGVDLARFGDDDVAAAYAATLLAMPEMAEWTEGAIAEMTQLTAG